jgi:hypothetical protein
LSVTPREFNGIFYGVNISAQNASETHTCYKLGVDGVVDPFIQCLRAHAAHDERSRALRNALTFLA